MKRTKRLTIIVMVCITLLSGTIIVSAKEATPVRGAILGYNYLGNLSLTTTRVKATLVGDAQISNEETPDAPELELSGQAYYDSDGKYQQIWATGIKSCRYEASIGNGTYALCGYKVEGSSVGSASVYL